MSTPRNPVASSPDDDPTGVRALLSSLPEPEPMPAYLVERISASLAAEQAQRADRFSDVSVTPMVGSRRRRVHRLLFAAAGTAAAVALIGVVGSNLLNTNQSTSAGDTSAAAIRTNSGAAEGAVPPTASDKAASGGAAAAFIEIRSSGTHYTATELAAQVSSLRTTARDQSPGMAPNAAANPIGTAAGLRECLSAIGAGTAQAVKADLAFYDGQPAVIIVATTDGIQLVYAVGRDCSRSHAALLRPALALP